MKHFILFPQLKPIEPSLLLKVDKFYSRLSFSLMIRYELTGISTTQVQEFGRPTFHDTCECMMNSVKMSCHKQALRRTYLMYGPSWRVPLHAKGLDVPHRAKPYNIAGKRAFFVLVWWYPLGTFFDFLHPFLFFLKFLM